MKYIFDENFSALSGSKNDMRIVWIILMYLFLFLSSLLHGVILNILIWNGTRNIINKSFDSVIKTDYSYFHQKPAAGIWNDLKLSSNRTAYAISSCITIVFYIISFGVYTYIIFNVNSMAALITLLVIPVTFLCNIGIREKSMSFQKKYIKAASDLSSMSVNCFTNVHNIKSKNKYTFFTKILDNLVLAENDAIIRMAFCENYLRSISDFFNSITPLIVIMFIMKQAKLIDIGTGEILVLYTFVPMVLSSFKEIYSTIVQYITSKSFITVANELVTMPSELSGDVKITAFENMDLKNISVSFSNGCIVHIPDFHISKGDKVLMLGQSGVGKSTLYSLLIGLIGGYQGSFRINGYELRELSKESLRGLFGISFQNDNVFWMTLEQNIFLDSEHSRDNMEHILSISNLKEFYHQKTDTVLVQSTLSGGEKARIAIAQNIACNTEVLLLDESFSSLNEEMEEMILTRIFEEFPNKTLILISHREFSRKFFDKTVLFSERKG